MRYLPLAILVLAGCGKGTSTKSTLTARPADDPWQKASSALRKDSDLDSCRRILNDLNGDLVKAPNAPQPQATSREDLAATTADYGWDEREAKEISTGTYSAFDAAYLAEVLYLRDVAVGLDVGSLPPAQRANAAFQWVCRQVVLTQPRPNSPALIPLPATYVLRRGSGTGMDRANVFLELCRQLNVDAYFVGPPDAKGKPAHDRTKLIRGPFWAVGTRAGNQVLLFDPWSGESLPFNLEEMRAASEKAVAWAKTIEVTADALKTAELFIAIPLSAWATRWKPLEEKLDSERSLKLSANREALLKSATNAAKGAPVGFWQAGGDRHSLPRTLAYTLSQLEGGFADNHPSGNSSLVAFYKASLIPGGQLLPLPEGIGFKEPRDRIQASSVIRYVQSFLNPPTPRERFQRGQFTEATRALVKEWDEYTKMVERDRGQPDRQKAIAEWVDRANRVYGQLNGAVNDAERAAAQNAVNQFWKSEAKTTEMLSEQTLGPAGMAEAVYLLALCKHEFAERLSLGAADPAALKPEAREAWQVAHDWWTRYRDFAKVQNEQYPGREAHAAGLAARAGRMAGVTP